MKPRKEGAKSGGSAGVGGGVRMVGGKKLGKKALAAVLAAESETVDGKEGKVGGEEIVGEEEANMEE